MHIAAADNCTHRCIVSTKYGVSRSIRCTFWIFPFDAKVQSDNDVQFYSATNATSEWLSQSTGEKFYHDRACKPPCNTNAYGMCVVIVVWLTSGKRLYSPITIAIGIIIARTTGEHFWLLVATCGNCQRVIIVTQKKLQNSMEKMEKRERKKSFVWMRFLFEIDFQWLITIRMAHIRCMRTSSTYIMCRWKLTKETPLCWFFVLNYSTICALYEQNR